MQIGGIFSCGDGADPFQQEPLDHVAVNAYYVADGVGPGGHGGQLEVDEMHMVAEDHVRGLQIIHVHFFYLVGFADEHDLGEEPNQPGPKFGLVHGVLGGFVPLFIFVINLNVHFYTSFHSTLYRKNVEKTREMR